MARPLPWLFPYVMERAPERHPLGRSVLRPIVEARVLGPAGESSKYAALIDSGSDYTLAAPIVAMEAGIDLRNGRPTTLQVGGAAREIWVVDATLRLCDPALSEVDGGCESNNAIEWHTEVGFFERWHEPPFPMILGAGRFLRRLHCHVEPVHPGRAR